MVWIILDSIIALLVVIGITMKMRDVVREKRRQREANWNAMEADESLHVVREPYDRCLICHTSNQGCPGKFGLFFSWPFSGPSGLRLEDNKGPVLAKATVNTLQRCLTCGATWRVTQFSPYRRKA
jgi:hypothetical protein